MKYFLMLVFVFSSISCVSSLSQRENFREWKEEVKLSDGRIIVVTQKKRCEGAYTGQNYAPCIAREAWLTLNMPEFSSQPIVWHESLNPIILNLSKGQLYLVGNFPTQREFRMYGGPQPPYICFKLVTGEWARIPFEEIPSDIYEINMLIESIPPDGIKYLSIDKKQSAAVNGSITYRKWQKVLDPSHEW
jgi:hypothetical protein